MVWYNTATFYKDKVRSWNESSSIKEKCLNVKNYLIHSDTFIVIYCETLVGEVDQITALCSYGDFIATSLVERTLPPRCKVANGVLQPYG